MVSISGSALKALVNDPPPAASTLPQPTPWVAPTPDRVLRTTAVPVLLQYGSALTGPENWGPNTAAFSAVSPPDPTTGQQYVCLVPGGGIRYDYSLNRAAVPGAPASDAGYFWATPLPDSVSGEFAAYQGWAYAVDSATGDHYFLCASSWTTPDSPNTLNWAPLSQSFGELGPPLMRTYRPKSGVVQPQGLWATGEIIWFTNSDGSLWQVAIADVIASSNASLKQVNSTGVVQAVVSDNASSPTYYVLSAVPNGGTYDLVEFPAGDPASAVTIQTNWSLGGFKTTPDGAVWRVIPDFNTTDPSQPTTAQVSYLAPTFPANGQTPTWIDPFATADPTFCPAGLAQTIMDAVPLSANNILLRTTTDNAADQSPDWNPLQTWQLTRVAIGVLDQPAVPFPSYTGDMENAYTQISQALINAPDAKYDIRAQYPSLSSADANGYYTNITTLTPPSDFPDVNAWNTVQNDLQNELYNLIYTLSFWEGTTALTSLQNQLNAEALLSVSNSLAIPTTATLIDTEAGNVNALTAIGGTLGGAGSILSLVSTVVGTCTFPVGSIITGVLSMGASLASIFCTTKASMETNYVINVSDPMYIISAKLGDLETILGQLFANTLTVITSASQACATDSGRLTTVGELARNQSWLNNTAQVVQDANSNSNSNSGSNQTPPPSFNDYYNACVVSYFQAFVPLVAGVNVIMINPNAGGSWPTYKGKPVYVSPTHQFSDSLNEIYDGALLQYASAHDQSKPLGQDLDELLFTTWKVPYVDVFLNWQIPPTPPWI